MAKDHEYKLKRSPIPTIAAIITAAVYAAVITLTHILTGNAPRLWLHIPLALIISRITMGSVSFFFPIRRIKTARRYIAPTSGVSEVDKQLKEADRILKETERIREQLKPINGTLSAAAARLVTNGRKILEYVAVNSDKAQTLHRFFGYYLPTLEKLLKNYILLENHAARTNNAETAKQEIEDAVCQMEEVFEKQLDKLFEDTALDITTDIDVLENVMTKDIGEKIMNKQTTPQNKDK